MNTTTIIILSTLIFGANCSQYLIASGRVSGAPDESTEVVELDDTSTTPSFGQLPSKRIDAVGAMIGNAPIICGGEYYGGYDNTTDSCITYHQDSQWTQSHSMIQKRTGHAFVQINSTTIWILGGFDGKTSFLDSTEFIIQGQTKGVPGPKLPYGLRGMCAAKVSENEVFVIGGWSEVMKDEVWIYDPQNGFARHQGPSLNTARQFFSCSTMTDGAKTLIVAAGGYNDFVSLDSVEIYDPTANTWHLGKKNW